MAGTPILLSFIDPGHPGHLVQLRCFAAWAALGGQPRAVTTPDGAEKLLALGLAPTDLLVLSGSAIRDRDGAALLVPLLRELAKNQTENLGGAGAPVMLVHPALWPALRTMGAITHWAGLAPALALTGEICATIDSHDPDDARPDRSRFAAFALTGSACAAVADLLAGCAGAEVLAFGDPGADQLLAAALRVPFVGGAVMDSGLLLDETVGRDPGADPEVGPFLGDITRLRGIAAPDAAGQRAILRQLIQRECRQRGPLRDTARMLYYRPVPRLAPPHPAALRIAAQLVAICPELTWWHSLAALAALAQRVSSEDQNAPVRAPDRALTFFVVNPDPQYQFTQILLAILFVQMCRATGGATGDAADAVWTLPVPSVPQEPSQQGDAAQAQARARVAVALGAAPFLVGRPAGLADGGTEDETGQHIAVLSRLCTTTAEHRILDALAKGGPHAQ